MLKVYCHLRCSTCKNALKYLDANNVSYELYDITKESVPYELLEQLHSSLDLDIKKFYNTSGIQYKELNMKDRIPTMSIEENLKTLSSNGMLVKRPFITDGKQLTLGFKEAEYSKWIK